MTIQIPTYDHIDQILALNSKYLINHLSDTEKLNGFIRIEYDREDIEKIIIKMFCSVQPILAHNYHSCQPKSYGNDMCFEILGLDIILDEKGKQFTSREFSQKIDTWMNSSVKKVHILIGGAYGFAEEIYSRANEKMSLSKMTFTHQMIRLFIVEQIYRADQILQGKPYHND